MIDFHTHILPGVDDGSQNTDESLSMLREEWRQGVRHIVATPHFYADRTTPEVFLAQRKESLQRLAIAFREHGAEVTGAPNLAPRIQTGAEVYFFPGMGRAEKLPWLCIQGTRQVLVEMPFAQWDNQVLREIEDILTKQKLQVVLAHVERYPEFQKDKRIWDTILGMTRTGRLTLQVNGGSFLKGRGRRKFCLGLLEEYDRVILGSDCHNMTSRVPNLGDARAMIEKKLGLGRLERMDQLAGEILIGEAK